MIATRSAVSAPKPRAWLAAAFVACIGTARAQSIDDAGIHAARVRSDFPAGVGTAASPLNLNYTLPTPEGCLFDAADSFAACAGRAGLPNLPNGQPVWAGGPFGRFGSPARPAQAANESAASKRQPSGVGSV